MTMAKPISFRTRLSAFIAPASTLAMLAMPALVTLAALPSPLTAAPVAPQASGANYVFAFPSEGPRLEVDPAAGARISSLKLGATEFLYVNRNQTNWGSTLWTAPQTAWNWPPPQAYDGAAYTGGPQGNVLVLAGPKDQASGFSFTKRISADDADTSITLAFTLKNGGTAAKQAALWQVTRVLPGGITFFPKGAGAARGDLVSQVKESGGWMWLDYATATIPGGTPKYFGDGAGGWMAHIDPNGLMLLELFPDITEAQAAPGEAEIEIYTDPGKQYMEIEHQGPYASLAAGDSVAWTTRWLLRKLPTGVSRKAGDPALVAWVGSLVARSPSALRGSPRSVQVSPRGTRLSVRPKGPGEVDAQGRRPAERKIRSPGK
jgi:Domain of unknown function (DUF4380)